MAITKCIRKRLQERNFYYCSVLQGPQSTVLGSVDSEPGWSSMAVGMCTDIVHFTVNRKWGEGRNKPKMTLVTYFLPAEEQVFHI